MGGVGEIFDDAYQSGTDFSGEVGEFFEDVVKETLGVAESDRQEESAQREREALDAQRRISERQIAFQQEQADKASRRSRIAAIKAARRAAAQTRLRAQGFGGAGGSAGAGALASLGSNLANVFGQVNQNEFALNAANLDIVALGREANEALKQRSEALSLSEGAKAGVAIKNIYGAYAQSQTTSSSGGST